MPRARVGLVVAAALSLCGCAVETVESDIADQQTCVTAERAAADADAAGSGTADRARALAGAADALRGLSATVQDEALREALERRSAAYDGQRRAANTPDGSDDPRASAAARTAEQVLRTACQRLTAF